METKEKRKRHADFQDAYRRSSNFNSIVKADENIRFSLKGDGKLKTSSKKIQAAEEDKLIEETLNSISQEEE
ncbi:hypothetical protein [Aegicerativicinus sediminis]|uniref:hypothetical protein n=1 Tax=Aegicerativicinus sediminis TaxID=2893202 RepID=UPI001E50D671|nr:hypothetical protein [Aegicerativicinus sediminis]